MDGFDIDNLVRELVGRASRRSVLRLGAVPLLGGAVGLAVVVDDTSAGKQCKKQKKKACVGRCGTVTYKCKKNGKKKK